ncbi:MAG TPA: filamentous hemagglutinin N-terminal domain-containing protein, partial [Novosphingobium sp.]|nr:filamentous hemagglutinin N-terminal domain-containing protein [Novosphingobium sp.]
MTAIVRRANSVSNRPLGRPLRRLALLGSTALVGSALAAGQAGAQSLPDLANAGGASVVFSGPGGGAPNDTMNVDLGGVSRVLDFNSYNIAAGNTASYATSVPSLTDLVAVNRVITGGGGPSLIDGTISAASGISVWLINQEGISYNGNAMLAGGSLMLSTLDFADPVDGPFRTAFAAPGAATGTAFSFAGTSTSPILIGGNLNVTGSIVAVGQQITTDGALTAGNGSVVLVAASAVTFTNGLGNPLAFSVDAGTTLGSIDVNANLTGRSVVVAGGVQNSMTAALLNVDAAATLTATAANGTVTLATSSVGPDITITNGAGGAPGIATSGRLLATGVGGDVRVQSAGDLTGGGVIAANSDVDLAAAGDISVATGNYTATNGALSASADGDATLGALTAGTDVTVTAGGSATLAGAANAGGALDVAASTSVTLAAATAGADVTIDAGGDTLVTGAVVAGRDFIVANTENYTQSGTVVAERDVTLSVNDDAVVTGAITATDGDFFATVGNDATFAAITAGTDITAIVGSNGDFTGVLVAGGDVDLTAGPSLFVRAAVTSGDDYVLTADDITLGDAATSPIQSAARRVFIHALNGNITGLGGLSLRSGADDSGFGNLELQADIGEVRFGLATALVAGTAVARTDAVITSAPNIALGDVTAARLYTLGDPTFGTLTASGTITTRDLAIDNALSIVSTGGAITTRNVTIGTLGAALQFYTPGAVTSTGTLATNGGNILVSSGGAITLGNAATALSGVAPTSGSIGLQATGTISAGTLGAGTDIAAQAGGTIAVTTARAGDDIDFASSGGNVSLGTGTASGTGAGGTGIVFAPVPGTPGAIGFGAEDVQLDQSTIRLRAQGGDVASATQLATANGDVIVNAARDAVLGAVTATGIGTGGAIAVRAGRDVRATALTSTSDDISVGADGNALLGTLTASDDIDLTVGGSLDWGTLRLTGGSDTARFANLSGTAGTSGGVNFLVPGVDLALAGNVVRIRAGSVGTAAAGPVGLIAQDVTSGDFTATALAGDIRIGDVTSSGNVTVTATLGSVTGLPGGYAPASGGVITGIVSGSGDGLVDTVLLDIGTTGAIGAITAGSVTSTGTATTLRIGRIDAGTVNLGAVQTLDLGSVTATGAVTLATS